MGRPAILPKDKDIVDRLRAHAIRMITDSTSRGGFSTATWEREDLESVLDQAADEIETLRRTTNTEGAET